MKPSNYMGEYCHLIRINGRRTIIGCGHTRSEALRNALHLAADIYPSVGHVFHLLKPSPYQVTKDDDIKTNNVRHDGLLKKWARIIGFNV